MKKEKITLKTDIKKPMKYSEILEQTEEAFQQIKAIKEDHPQEAEKLSKRLLGCNLRLMMHNLGLQKQQPFSVKA